MLLYLKELMVLHRTTVLKACFAQSGYRFRSHIRLEMSLEQGKRGKEGNLPSLLFPLLRNLGHGRLNIVTFCFLAASLLENFRFLHLFLFSRDLRLAFNLDQVFRF